MPTLLLCQAALVHTGKGTAGGEALTEADGTHTMMVRGVTWFDVDRWIIGRSSIVRTVMNVEVVTFYRPFYPRVATTIVAYL